MADNGGATIGGVTFTSLGLIVLKTNIPLMPETRQVEEEIPGKDGSIDMETTFGPRVIEIDVQLTVTDGEQAYQIALQNIAKTFNPRKGVQSLILDRMTGKRWLVKYNGTIPIEKIAQIGVFTIPFKAFYPFAESVNVSTAPLTLDDGYVIGMGLRLDDTYTHTVNTSPKTVSVYHAGTYDVKPIIRITGAGTNISVTNDTTAEGLTWTGTLGAADVLEIDCTKCTVTKNGVNAYSGFSGTFPKLTEGDNSITIAGTSLNCGVSFVFRHTYLY